MPRRTTRKHPADQLYIEVRAWFLEIIRTDCPQVLDDRWTEVFLPRRAALSQTAAVTLLRQMTFLRGSLHRSVRAAIVRQHG